MKAIYDGVTDTLTLKFKDARIAESDEDKPGVILDYDDDGDLVAMEILDASHRVSDPEHVEIELAG